MVKIKTGDGNRKSPLYYRNPLNYLTLVVPQAWNPGIKTPGIFSHVLCIYVNSVVFAEFTSAKSHVTYFDQHFA